MSVRKAQENVLEVYHGKCQLHQHDELKGTVVAFFDETHWQRQTYKVNESTVKLGQTWVTVTLNVMVLVLYVNNKDIEHKNDM